MELKWLLGFIAVSLAVHETEAQDGYFWHITDYHYDESYWTDGNSCNGVSGRGIYGDYWCDSPWRLVADSIAAMASKRPNVDFIIWTGDNVAHVKNDETNTTLNFDILSDITQEIKQHFPGTPVYATMGNHDWWPADQYPVTSAELYNLTADLWGEWLGGAEQVNNFRKGAYYTVKTSQDIRIIGLNTNLYYTPNKNTTNNPDPAGQFAWLEDVLQKAKTAGEKVWITAHVPPGIHTPGKLMWFYKNFNTHFNDIVRAYAGTIACMLFGHDHEDGFKLMEKTDASPGIPMFVAPSITPWRYKLSSGETGEPHNPAIRLVKYDRVTKGLLDIHQYYMDLATSNSNNRSEWVLAYKASETYGMPDLTATSIDNLVKRMGTNSNILDNYIRYNTVLANQNETVKA